MSSAGRGRAMASFIRLVVSQAASATGITNQSGRQSPRARPQTAQPTPTTQIATAEPAMVTTSIIDTSHPDRCDAIHVESSRSIEVGPSAITTTAVSIATMARLAAATIGAVVDGDELTGTARDR